MAEERHDKGGEPGKGGEEWKDRRRFGGRRRFGKPGNRDDRPRQEGEAEKAPPADAPAPPSCPLCGKPVYDLSTAVAADMDSGAPAHFDCVIERIAAAESLGPQERLVYLGSGSFGVVEYKDKSETLFVVKRRIQWEKEGDKRDWRRGLSSKITKL